MSDAAYNTGYQAGMQNQPPPQPSQTTTTEQREKIEQGWTNAQKDKK